MNINGDFCDLCAERAPIGPAKGLGRVLVTYRIDIEQACDSCRDKILDFIEHRRNRTALKALGVDVAPMRAASKPHLPDVPEAVSADREPMRCEDCASFDNCVLVDQIRDPFTDYMHLDEVDGNKLHEFLAGLAAICTRDEKRLKGAE